MVRDVTCCDAGNVFAWWLWCGTLPAVMQVTCSAGGCGVGRYLL